MVSGVHSIAAFDSSASSEASNGQAYANSGIDKCAVCVP